MTEQTEQTEQEATGEFIDLEFKIINLVLSKVKRKAGFSKAMEFKELVEQLKNGMGVSISSEWLKQRLQERGKTEQEAGAIVSNFIRRNEIPINDIVFKSKIYKTFIPYGVIDSEGQELNTLSWINETGLRQEALKVF